MFDYEDFDDDMLRRHTPAQQQESYRQPEYQPYEASSPTWSGNTNTPAYNPEDYAGRLSDVYGGGNREQQDVFSPAASAQYSGYGYGGGSGGGYTAPSNAGNYPMGNFQALPQPYEDVFSSAASAQYRSNQEEGPPQRGGFRFPAMSNDQMNLVRALGGLGSLFAQRNKQKALQAAAKQQDPFGPQRPQYQTMLSQAYNDPYAHLNSPMARAQQEYAQQALARKQAAGGMRAAGSPGLSRALAAQQADQIERYRAGLMTPAGANISPSGAAQLQSAAADAGVKQWGAPFAALGDIYGSSNNLADNAGYAALKRDIEARLGKG